MPGVCFSGAEAAVWSVGRGAAGAGFGTSAIWRLFCEAALLVDEGGNDLGGKGRGCLGTPASVLDQYGDNDVRIPPRGHADKPGVGALISLSEALRAGAVVHDLRGAGLAGEIDVCHVKGGSRAIDSGLGHGVCDQLPVGGRKLDRLIAGAGKGLAHGLQLVCGNLFGEDDVRAAKDSSGGDAAERAGELHGAWRLRLPGRCRPRWSRRRTRAGAASSASRRSKAWCR